MAPRETTLPVACCLQDGYLLQHILEYHAFLNFLQVVDDAPQAAPSFGGRLASGSLPPSPAVCRAQFIGWSPSAWLNKLTNRMMAKSRNVHFIYSYHLHLSAQTNAARHSLIGSAFPTCDCESCLTLICRKCLPIKLNSGHQLHPLPFPDRKVTNRDGRPAPPRGY